MTEKTFLSLTDDPEPNARSVVDTAEYPRLSDEYQPLRALIDKRRVGAFVDLDEGEAATRALITRKRHKRAAL